jgi:hypothetical protein
MCITSEFLVLFFIFITHLKVHFKTFNFKILLHMSSPIHHQISRVYNSSMCMIKKGVASNQHWRTKRTASFVVLFLAEHNCKQCDS